MSRGDLALEEVNVDQCWDAAQAQVYLLAEITSRADVDRLVLEGDPAQCAVAGGDVTLLLSALAI